MHCAHAVLVIVLQRAGQKHGPGTSVWTARSAPPLQRRRLLPVGTTSTLMGDAPSGTKGATGAWSNFEHWNG